ADVVVLPSTRGQLTAVPGGLAPEPIRGAGTYRDHPRCGGGRSEIVERTAIAGRCHHRHAGGDGGLVGQSDRVVLAVGQRVVADRLVQDVDTIVLHRTVYRLDELSLAE